MFRIAFQSRLLGPRVYPQKHGNFNVTTRQPNLILCMSTQVQDHNVYGLQRVTRGRKDVTTAFVQRPSDGSIIVVQRSQEVGTYQLKWGGVSGGIEGNESVVDRGLQEIFEELGYSPEHVVFVRSGRPLYVDDGSRHFAVHPLLFKLAPGAEGVEPKTNWENVAYKWVRPDAIGGLDAVPMLVETWERLVVTEQQQAALETLKNDRIHGAAEVAKLGLQYFEEESESHCEVFKHEPEQSFDEGTFILDTLRNWGYHLATCRPSMAPLGNTIAETLSVVHKELSARADAFEACNGEVCFALSKAVKEQSKRLKDKAEQLFSNAESILTDNITILTISYSSSVLESVKIAAKTKKIRAIVCESRPLYEGVSLAKAWAEAGIDVTVITDAQAAVFVKKADLVLTGADAVTQRVVVNKVGTYLLALAAADAGVPVYALADTTKLTPGSIFNLAHPGGEAETETFHEEKSVDELTANWNLRFGHPTNGDKQQPSTYNAIKSVRNVYFEDVPLSMYTGVITERGVLPPEDVADEVARLKQLHKLAFQLD